MAQAGSRKRARRTVARPTRRRHRRAQVRLLLRRRQGGRLERAARPARRQGLRAGRDDQARASRCRPASPSPPQAWAAYNAAGSKQPAGLWEQVLAHLARLEAAAGSRLGDPTRPLLVSVRSGARASMPGMMDTVLNLGLNDRTVEGLAARTRNERFAWDCYRRFITMFGDVVLAIERHAFDARLDAAKARARREDRRRSAGRGPAGAGRGVQAGRAGHDGPALPAGSRTSSSGWRSTRSSTPGGPRRRWTTGASTACPTTGAPR